MTVTASHPSLQARDNVRGVLAMATAVATLTIMDACLKLLSPHYSPFQVVALRGLGTLPIVALWVVATGGFRQVREARVGLHIARGLVGIAMLAGFTFALRSLSLSDAYAIFFVAPLLITALAAPLLRERVDTRRWAAILIGFGGVLIVLRPTAAGALSIPGLAVLLAALGYALSAIAVRVAGRTDTTQAMVFWVMLVLAAGATLVAMPGWSPVQSVHWPIVGALAMTGAVGQWALTEAFRRAEVSVVAPFEYTALAWGAGLDWILWRTLPAPVTLVGATFIIGSGIYIIRRERVHAEAEHP